MNWDQAGSEAVERLRRMLRFDTTNPPGNELALARDLAKEAEENGLRAVVYESAEERGNLVIRVKGDGSRRPLLLLSHLDVVPAEPDRWRFPPFAGELAEGYVCRCFC